MVVTVEERTGRLCLFCLCQSQLAPALCWGDLGGLWFGEWETLTAILPNLPPSTPPQGNYHF